jgi:uncharacterized membrane protein
MQSKAKIFGHPVHPMLVVFPLGLFATSLVFDVIAAAGGGGTFSRAAFYMVAAGIIGGLLAAVFGAVDWLAIPAGTRAKRVGALHGIANVVVVALFIGSWGVRYGAPDATLGTAVILSVIAIGVALFSGWLGGELVDRLGVGVDEGAHLDSPSALSGRPASERHGEVPPLVPRRAT